MSDPSSYLVTAIIALASAVAGLAGILWREKLKSSGACEKKLDACLEEVTKYERPARIATQELLANANMLRRGRSASSREADGPWPWPDAVVRQRPRTPRRRS